MKDRIFIGFIVYFGIYYGLHGTVLHKTQQNYKPYLCSEYCTMYALELYHSNLFCSIHNWYINSCTLQVLLYTCEKSYFFRQYGNLRICSSKEFKSNELFHISLRMDNDLKTKAILWMKGLSYPANFVQLNEHFCDGII